MKKTLFVLFAVLIGFGALAQKTSEDFLKSADKLIDKKQYKKALVELDSALALDPGFAHAYAMHGLCQYELGLFKEALDDFDQALNLQPDYAEVYHLRGMARGELGDTDGACDDWNYAFNLGYNGVIRLLEEFCNDEEY